MFHIFAAAVAALPVGGVMGHAAGRCRWSAMSTFRAIGHRGGGSGIFMGVVPPGLVKSLSLPHTDFSKKRTIFYPEIIELHSPVFALEIAEGSQE